MYCIKCGQELPENAVFCPKCGTKVMTSLNNSNAGKNNSENEVAIQQNNTQINNPADNTENNYNTAQFIVSLLILLIVGWYLYPVFFPSTPSSSTRVTASNKVRTDSLMNGDPEESIKRLLGEPNDISESHVDNKTTTRRYSYDGLYITARNGVIDYIKKDLQVINDAPIRRRDSFIKVRWYRGEPLRKEEFVILKDDVDPEPLNLYEYADYVIITQCPQTKIQRELVLGFVPKGCFSVATNAIGLKEVTFTIPVNMDGEIPLKVAGNSNTSGAAKSSTTLQDFSALGDPIPPEPASAQSSKTTNNNSKMQCRITGTDVNMRSGPGRNYGVIGSFDKNEIVFQEDFETTKDGSWSKVRRNNGNVGWVSAQYCKLIESSATQSSAPVSQSSSVPAQSSNTKDVWVAHWDYENVDIYVVDGTISSGTSDTGKYFTVMVKQVQNGKEIQTNKWKFIEYRGDWRYTTDVMEKKGTTSIVFNNKVFEYCMKQLGWPFIAKDGYYH